MSEARWGRRRRAQAVVVASTDDAGPAAASTAGTRRGRRDEPAPPPRPTTGRALLALGGILVAAAGSAAGAAALAAPEQTQVWATVSDARIVESSGLAAGQAGPRRLWTHNDSGDGPVLYGLAPDGTVSSTLRLEGVSARDWESMAAATLEGRPVLVVGDIGDNAASRDSVQVHVVPEPSAVGDLVATPMTYTLTYPNGPRDAEALLVDPVTKDILVVEKTLGRAGVYRIPPATAPGTTATWERIGTVSGLVTDADALADGRYVLRTYTGAFVYEDFFGTAPEPLALPLAPQGESLAAHWDDRSVLVGSEGSPSTIYRVPVPPVASQPAPMTAGDTSEQAGSDAGDSDGPVPAPGTSAGDAATAEAGDSDAGDSHDLLAAAAPWSVALALALTAAAILVRSRR